MKLINYLRYISSLGLLLGILFVFSCASTTVERTAVDTVTDLSGRWNDTDSRLVSEAMINDMLNAPWIANFTDSHDGKQPVIIPGFIKNRSSEHIETTTFIKDIERAMVNSGRISVVASSPERTQVREERTDQQTESSFDSVKRLGEEQGADFMLTGVIVSQTDAAGKITAVTYQVSLELVNIESNRKIWIGDKKIKKIINQPKYRL